MSTYAVSDLHGQYEAFLRGLAKINIGKNDMLYVIGDAIDRGPNGIKILRHVMSEKNMDLLIGNHEFMMLNAVDPLGKIGCDGRDAELWLLWNGGDKTYEEYKMLTDDERKELLDWMRKRKVIKTLRIGKERFCLTHSYYMPEFENKQYCKIGYQDVSDITWKSIYREGEDTHADNIYKDYVYTFVTGHVPVQRIRNKQSNGKFYGNLFALKEGNLIDIDGYCALGYDRKIPTGAIFLRLDDMREFPVPLLKGE